MKKKATWKTIDEYSRQKKGSYKGHEVRVFLKSGNCKEANVVGTKEPEEE